MNGGACCILELCCENSSAAAADALSAELVKDGIVADKAAGDAVANWMLKHFEFAERGTLSPMKKSWAKHVRDHK